ncbi:MAG: hypothetical protein Q9216_000460 [Gyalolechia sp. 2 TL-2023]
MISRSKPNVIVTGTPGVGKTSLCKALLDTTDLQHLPVNRIAKEGECHEGWDEDMKSWIVDEDKLLDAIEVEINHGGCLIDWHACDLFPESWIDLVVVLRSHSTVLYDRLAARNYTGPKLQENMDAEIMEVLLAEARNAFDEEIVIELQSNSLEDMESNVARIEAWVARWKQDHGRAIASADYEG